MANALRRQAPRAFALTTSISLPSLLHRLPRSHLWAVRPFSTTLCRAESRSESADNTSTRQRETGSNSASHWKYPPSRGLFFTNFPKDANESDLRDAASPFGEIESVRLLWHLDGMMNGYGFVNFAAQSAADQCLNAGLEISGHALKLAYPRISERPRVETNTPTQRFPRRRQLFLSNLPFAANEDDVLRVFKPFGEIESIRILRTSDGSTRGYAYVTFAKQSAADACVLSPLEIFGRTIRFGYAHKRDLGPFPPSHVLHLSDLPPNTEPHHIHTGFESFGVIRAIRLYSEGGSEIGEAQRLTAHVQFASKGDAVRAYEKSAGEPLYIMQRRVRVDYGPGKNLR
ncbi:hypothetical protein R3P38DRAFT_2932422 [Favolaschia claudopus]|uniref:RRM domain-containing protein n=1 Tax=Favolaschia claudopus TaxID=2862362 RepID=A0AAW0BST9_9AGAR